MKCTYILCTLLQQRTPLASLKESIETANTVTFYVKFSSKNSCLIIRVIISQKSCQIQDHFEKSTQTKAKLLLLKLIHLFAREVLLVKKLEIAETRTTQYSTFKTDMIKVGLVFSFFNFFITKTSLANKWMTKKIHSCSNSALVCNLEDVPWCFVNSEFDLDLKE